MDSSTLKNKISDASSYLKEKVSEMERHQSSGISDARKRAHDKLEELKRAFEQFETACKNPE